MRREGEARSQRACMRLLKVWNREAEKAMRSGGKEHLRQRVVMQCICIAMSKFLPEARLLHTPRTGRLHLSCLFGIYRTACFYICRVLQLCFRIAAESVQAGSSLETRLFARFSPGVDRFCEYAFAMVKTQSCSA